MRRYSLTGLLLFFALLLFLAPATKADDPVATTAANVMVELSFHSTSPHSDPFNQVELDALFTSKAGVQWRVPAFWDGGDLWKVRFAVPDVGTYRYRTECSDAADSGLHGRTGSVEVRPYTGDNALLRHGPIRVAADKRHFEHADGTAFFWLGDTWWMGLCDRLPWPDGFKALAADRKAKGFDVIQIVAGLYPDMGAFDPRGANEAGFPWEKDYARIRPEYFDRADERIAHLVDQGFVPCIVGAWGYHLPWLGQEKMRKHMRYISARWGAYPVVWCAGGEFNLPYYLAEGFPLKGEGQTAGWNEVIRYLRTVNAFGRPITAHPTGISPMSARLTLQDPSVLDFDMLQTPHGQIEALPTTVKEARGAFAVMPPIPVINGECSYEQLLGRIPADYPRMFFWIMMAHGAAGHTYGANGIWQVNQPGKPYGNSPHGGNYGTIPWTDSMNLPGSRQVGLGKKLLESYPWQRFSPHFEWATWSDTGGAPTLGHWIWFPEGNPTVDAPVAKRYFRRTFTLADGAKVKRVELFATADDACTVWVNGKELGATTNWKSVERFAGFEAALHAGRNVLAIAAENRPAPVRQNPASLICGLNIELESGEHIRVTSGDSFRAAQAEIPKWNEADFDDGKWPAAMVTARLGEGPWGKIVADKDEFLVPYAFGIESGVRLVYVPVARDIVLRKLAAGGRYSATWFDPVEGTRNPLNAFAAGDDGTWTCAVPKITHDWVLIVEPDKAK
ncbi:MAG: alpha-L-rhamnosidase family protein [Phycisphaerales bacterium]|nr:alpha-L-rhamnosidase family protein [Phycisphaerales bacterium]